MIVGKYKITGEKMDVVLSEEYEVKEDSKAYTLGDTTARKKGDIVYNNPHYFANVNQALKWILSTEVNATGLEDLQTVVNKIDSLEKLIDNLDLEEVKEEIRKPTMSEIEQFFADDMKEEAMD